jgi:hypothetical protein
MHARGHQIKLMDAGTEQGQMKWAESCLVANNGKNKTRRWPWPSITLSKGYHAPFLCTDIFLSVCPSVCLSVRASSRLSLNRLPRLLAGLLHHPYAHLHGLCGCPFPWPLLPHQVVSIPYQVVLPSGGVGRAPRGPSCIHVCLSDPRARAPEWRRFDSRRVPSVCLSVWSTCARP